MRYLKLPMTTPRDACEEPFILCTAATIPADLWVVVFLQLLQLLQLLALSPVLAMLWGLAVHCHHIYPAVVVFHLFSSTHLFLRLLRRFLPL
jgi:hypothetical protein